MRRAVALFVLLLGCRRTTVGPELSITATLEGTDAADDGEVGVAPPITETIWNAEASLPEELRDVAPFGNDVKRATCGKREGCKVLRERAAGNEGGRMLSVAVVEVGKWDMDRREYWVLARSGGSMVGRARIAQEEVVPGKEGDASLTVGHNRLTTRLTWWPTSNWQSWPERTFRLWPPRMTAFEDMPHFRGDGSSVFGQNSLTFTDGSGTGSYRCDDGRKADYLPIPAAARDAGLDPAKGLGQCAVIADGTKNHGYLLSGAADRASGHFAVAFVDALYVEVHDDRWTPGDAIEVHVGRPAGFMQCTSEVTPAQKYVVDAGGIVTSPSGGKPLDAKLVRIDERTRTFRIELPEQFMSGVTIAQRDDDRDGKVVRVIATSPLNTSPELGELAYTRASCARSEDGTALVPVGDK